MLVSHKHFWYTLIVMKELSQVTGSVTQPETPKASVAPQKSSRKLIILLVVVILMLAVAIVVLVLRKPASAPAIYSPGNMGTK